MMQRIPYGLLVPVALVLGLAPFRPQPHLVEKLRMLVEGTLHRPIDMFDLVLHGLPVLLLVLKLGADVRTKVFGRARPPA